MNNLSRQSVKNYYSCFFATGVLPVFASWALTQLGSAHLYAHSSGVNQVFYCSAFNVQWESEIWTKQGWFANGSDFEWHLFCMCV